MKLDMNAVLTENDVIVMQVYNLLFRFGFFS